MDIVSSVAATVAIASPIALALVELAKQTGKIPDWLKPILALLFGIGVAFLIAEDLTTQKTIVAGIIAGLSAAGLYSGTKAITDSAT